MPASTNRWPIVRLPAPCGMSTNCSALAAGEAALGFTARQALVFRRDRQRRSMAERLDERHHAFRFVGRRAVEAARQSDDDRRQAVILGCEPRDAFPDTIDRLAAED